MTQQSDQRVWGERALEAYAVLHGHLSEDGKPLEPYADFLPGHYLSADEWSEVLTAAQQLVDLVPLILHMPGGRAADTFAQTGEQR